jgi:hypothetical protein
MRVGFSEMTERIVKKLKKVTSILAALIVIWVAAVGTIGGIGIMNFMSEHELHMVAVNRDCTMRGDCNFQLMLQAHLYEESLRGRWTSLFFWALIPPVVTLLIAWLVGVWRKRRASEKGI